MRTFEKREDGIVHDIFDPDGKLAGKLIWDSFARYEVESYTYAKAQKRRLYFLIENEDYLNLVVSEFKGTAIF